MRIDLIKLTLLLFCVGGFFDPVVVYGQDLRLKAEGTEEQGYQVAVYNGEEPLFRNDGEFSLQLFNHDLSTETFISNWKGEMQHGDEKKITLQKDIYVKEFDAHLSVSVTYEVVGAGIVKKQVKLVQNSMPAMYYILKQSARPVQPPKQYVSFEHANFPGGLVHEMYPATGYITGDNQVVGFLTEAGYKNQYTRNTRRRFSGRGGGFVGMRRLADPNLFSVATLQERKEGHHYINHTLGELYNLDAGTVEQLDLPKLYTSRGNATLFVNKDSISIKGKGGTSGIEFMAPFTDQQVYTISFLVKGNAPLSLKLFRVKNGRKTVELENGVKYIDQFPVLENEWTVFKGSVMVPYIENDSVSLFIGSNAGNDYHLEIKDLQLVKHNPRAEPYNFLPLGDTVVKTSYVFTEPWVSQQQFMISSQARLAEGKGFKGSLLEKMLYANFNMLTWIADVDDMSPFNVPNMNYAPDMYNRDSYFSIVATYNKELNLAIWEKWGKTQTAKGGIGTIITPLMGSVEAKDNEATIEWLMWALLNKRRFGVQLPHDKIKKAVDYVLNEFDADRDGICEAHFPLSQIDVIDYTPKTKRLAVNQGMLAIALRTIKELGFHLEESYINKAEQAYRNFYDTKRKHLMFDRQYPDLVSLTDLEPEFFSLWMFNKPLLTDEMVQNHLNHVPALNKVAGAPHPEYGTTAPILFRSTRDKKGYAFLSKGYQPFEKFGEDNYSDGRNDGYYYNGGSWFRAEYCAYVVGLKHGWAPAKKRMENRAWAEIYLHPEWPFSKEFIPTQWTSTDSWWPSTKGLCWNVFMLMANEVAGLRSPDMDPDYQNLYK
ncbi:MAG TPA: hypothetical protein VFQ73_08825 [Flavisolibacter sp.]|nr:hypothetical protein [Flavisolibacter sp.]